MIKLSKYNAGECSKTLQTLYVIRLNQCANHFRVDYIVKKLP